MKRLLAILLFCAAAPLLRAEGGGELRFCLQSDPKTFHPLAVADDASETIRFLTAGVLIRMDRPTQQLKPELAASWKVEGGGRKITFELRKGLRFSDGTPFSAADVVHTLRALLDEKLHSPTADAFRTSSVAPQIVSPAPDRVSITFHAPVSGLELLFDQVGILSAQSPKKEMAVLGPFFVAEYKPGVEMVLQRNPHYWKRDAQGRALPYLDGIRLFIQQNRDMEMVRFRRGQLDLINSIPPDLFDNLGRSMPGAVRDAGPSMDAEMMWFNQVAKAPLAAHKKAWFRSAAFRRAVSGAIHRADIGKVIFHGHASPAAGPISPANRFWYNTRLAPHPYDPAGALARLRQEGFRLEGGTLRDRAGNPVEFSLITNAGNKTRERMAVLIQQDLQKIGIRLQVVTLDFPSLIERITRSFDYDTCLLGLTNVDLDPNAQMNVWLSSATNHQFNPNQPKPETEWEAEIDRLMRAQASAPTREKRKALFDQVQEIVSREVPFIYLVHKNTLLAMAPSVANAAPAQLRPQAFWNIERLTKTNQTAGKR